MIGGRIELGRAGGWADGVVLRLFGDRRRSPQKTGLPNFAALYHQFRLERDRVHAGVSGLCCAAGRLGGDGETPVPGPLPDGPQGVVSLVLTLPRTGTDAGAGGGAR
jgi:hypothetical protein